MAATLARVKMLSADDRQVRTSIERFGLRLFLRRDEGGLLAKAREVWATEEE